MNITYKQLFLISFLSFLISSCMYSNVTHLSDDDLEWIEGHKYGKSILFVSDSGNTDTLVLSYKYINNSGDRFYFSEGRGPDNIANAGYYFYMSHDGESFKGWISIKKIVSNSLLATINVWWRYVDEFDVSFHDSVLVNETNSAYPPVWTNKVHNKVTEYKWDKKRGLVYYRFEDGEEFYRKD